MKKLFALLICLLAFGFVSCQTSPAVSTNQPTVSNPVELTSIPKEFCKIYKIDSITKDGENWEATAATIELREKLVMIGAHQLTVEKVVFDGKYYYIYFVEGKGGILVYNPKQNAFIIANRETLEPLMGLHVAK